MPLVDPPKRLDVADEQDIADGLPTSRVSASEREAPAMQGRCVLHMACFHAQTYTVDDALDLVLQTPNAKMCLDHLEACHDRWLGVLRDQGRQSLRRCTHPKH